MNRQEAMEKFRLTGIYGITAEKLSAGRTNRLVVEGMLEGGIRFLQYREKEKDARSRYEECLELRVLTRKYHAVFIIDDFIDLAQAVEADGVHIGQEDLPPQVVRRILGEQAVIGLSTHNPEQLEAANAMAGIIDYIGTGPVYATQTKQHASPVTGLDYVRYAAEHAKLPFTAIGGIKLHNIAEVREAGAVNAAVVSEITGAADVAAMVHRLRNAMQPAG